MFFGLWWDQIGSLVARTLLLSAVLLQLFFVLPSQNEQQQAGEAQDKSAMQLSSLRQLEMRLEFAETKLSIEQQSTRFLSLIDAGLPELSESVENAFALTREEVIGFQEYLTTGRERLDQLQQRVEETLVELDNIRVASSLKEAYFSRLFLWLFVVGSILEVVCQTAGYKRENS